MIKVTRIAVVSLWTVWHRVDFDGSPIPVTFHPKTSSCSMEHRPETPSAIDEKRGVIDAVGTAVSQ